MSQSEIPASNRRKVYRRTTRLFTAAAALVMVVLVGMAVVISGLRQEVDNLGEQIERGGIVLSDLIDGQDDIASNQEAARQRGFATRAINCINNIVDNDRDFELTAACTAQNVTHYYPSSICRNFFPMVEACGSRVEDPAD